jgi:ABC-type multidrug transport system ATPase subunit
MQIQLQQVGKKFNKEWIFKNIDFTFYNTNSYAIVGKNGSGKSTLLQVIAGATNCSTGKISYTINNHLINENDIFSHVAIAAPYIEIIEEMTATEFLQFHFSIKGKPILPIDEILQKVDLQAAAQKQIRYFSSGMKQRIKLAQAFFSEATLLLLDEPCTNLDAAGITLYNELITEFTAQKLVIVCSNDDVEYSFCTNKFNIQDFK